jgi:serine O-acetyltransferase
MQDSDPIWDIIVEEAQQAAVEEPVLEAFFQASVLNHASLDGALSYNLAEQLGSPAVPSATIAEVIAQALREDTSIGQSIRLDIRASFERDAACDTHFIF